MERYLQLKPLIKPLLLTIIFLLPLIGSYKGLGYEQIKVFFFIISISLLGFIWLLQKPKLEWNLIRLASFIFLLALFISSLFGIDFKNSFLGIEPYFQGWVMYAYMFIFALIIRTSRIKLETYAITLVLSGIIVSVLAIDGWILANILGLDIPNYAGRVISTFGQPNFYSGFLLLVLPFCYLLLQSNPKERKLQLLGWGSGVIFLLAILVSYSRTAIFLSLILLLLALLNELKFRYKLLLAGIILVVLIFASVYFSSGFIWKEFSKPLSTSNPDLTRESVESRVYIWPQAVKVGFEKPLLGYGLENTNRAFPSYFQKYKHPIFEENLNISPVLISLKDLNIDRTHNYLLDIFLFSGAVGVISYLFLIILLFKKVKQRTLLVSLITYLVWVQFQNQSIAQLLYFWLIVGLIDY